MSDRIGLLRERLAAAEVARVREVAERGVTALLMHAVSLASSVAEDERAFSALTSAVEQDPQAAAAHMAEYLRQRGGPPRRLARDLASLKKKGPRLDLPALAERIAVRVFRTELECEVALAFLTAGLNAENAAQLPVDAVIDLAERPGRWSRRVEALQVLRVLAGHGPSPEQRARMAQACDRLASPSQQRWVQPAALEALFRLDANRAVAVAADRFARPGGGDDFLVRERFLDLVGRSRSSAWGEVLDAAMSDPSEHVRITLARVCRNTIPLTHMATSDPSDKVRVQALLQLMRRTPQGAETHLCAALRSDTSPFVVKTAAESLTSLARKRLLTERVRAREALVAAASRADLKDITRAAILEELAAVEVLVDPLLRVVCDMLARAVEHVPPGGAIQVEGPVLKVVSEAQVAQVLSVLSQHDYAMSADRTPEGFVIFRGEARRMSVWRILEELRSPIPSKRQGYVHSWGKKLRGAWRAPPRGLAELTATNVPGERVLVPRTGDWGRHLPLVDDLLASSVLRGGATRVVSPTGTTVITAPSTFGARLRGWLRLTAHYKKYAEQRRRSLESDEAKVQRGYAEAVWQDTRFRLEFEPYVYARALPPPRELPVRQESKPGAVASVGAALMTVPVPHWISGVSRDIIHYTLSPAGNRLPHVGAYAAAVLVGMLARAVIIRRLIDADRRAIPLVFGGWGTRGKSGTERIKAGMLQGLGYEVLVKTTGCEAMFIHAVPGLRASEVFIYRPYDKATIWEQSGLLRLGRRFGVRAFLWECMALQPDLVNLLHAQWMRDDYSTITNAYPDHEDVQGPAGIDVATVISEFVPFHGRLFTAEDQMLPLIREQAKKRKTSIRSVGDREAQLIASDTLARFPYHEHPKNIALVVSLAQAMGVPSAVAMAEMADHVVPDLGVLRTYPRVDYAGRSLAFTNGMSANERTGALSNWVRMGFDKREGVPRNRRYVTVVNNRADRVARSEVFARFLVQDIGAHVHVLIGTNVSGLRVFLRQALEKHVADITPSRDLQGSSEERRVTVMNRLVKALHRLELADLGATGLDAEVQALGWPRIDPRELEIWLTPARMDEPLAEARTTVAKLVPSDYPEEPRGFLVTMIARRRVARAVFDAVSLVAGDPARLDRIFSEAYLALFDEQVVPLFDSSLTGDQVIDRVAKSCPPGATVDIMGVQNIKGTGLDFVYRWVSLDSVERALGRVRAGGEERRAGLRELLMHDDYGLVDSRHALATLQSLAATAGGAEQAAFGPVLQRLEHIVGRKRAALSAAAARSFGDSVRAVVGKTFDFLDSMRRRTRAHEVLEELVAGRLSHAAAAVEMRAVVARAKGGWAKRKIAG